MHNYNQNQRNEQFPQQGYVFSQQFPHPQMQYQPYQPSAPTAFQSVQQNKEFALQGLLIEFQKQMENRMSEIAQKIEEGFRETQKKIDVIYEKQEKMEKVLKKINEQMTDNVNKKLKDVKRELHNVKKLAMRIEAKAKTDENRIMDSKDEEIDDFAKSIDLKIHREFNDHFGTISQLVLSKDGSKLFSSASDKTIKMWDTKMGVCMKTFSGHTNRVYSICISPDEKFLISGSGDLVPSYVGTSADKTIRIWDIETGECVHTIQEAHTNPIKSMCMSEDGNYLIAGSRDCIKIWDFRSFQELHTMKEVRGEVTSIFMNEQEIISTTSNGTISFWDLNGKLIKSYKDPNSINCAIPSKDKNFIIFGSSNIIKIWNCSDGTELTRLTGHSKEIYSLCLLNEDYLISGSDDKSLRIWNLDTGECKTIENAHKYAIHAVNSFNDFIFSSGASTITVWKCNHDDD